MVSALLIAQEHQFVFLVLQCVVAVAESLMQISSICSTALLPLLMAL